MNNLIQIIMAVSINLILIFGLFAPLISELKEMGFFIMDEEERTRKEMLRIMGYEFTERFYKEHGNYTYNPLKKV